MGDLNIYSNADNEYAQELKIVDVIRHPNYKFTSSYYDIALMKLERNVSVTRYVIPTCLWLEDEIRFPNLMAAGWGRTGFSENTSEILMKVQLSPVREDKCLKHYRKGDYKYRNGLLDHQLCAGDEEMDTCPGDSGGPLHVMLLKDKKLVPFLVGVTSFGKICGVPAPGVYIKVSKFGDWIIETLQRYGEMATRLKFDPMICSDRYYEEREDDKIFGFSPKGNVLLPYIELYTAQQTSSSLIRFGWPHEVSPGNRNCSGTLIEPNVVLTLAECVFHMGSYPTQVVLKNRNIIDIAEIIVHPLYNSSISPYYNNIAVVKLKSFAPVEPSCAWYGNPNRNKKLLVTGQRRESDEHYGKPRVSTLMASVRERSSKQCLLTQQYLDSLPRDLEDEHLCYENDPFIVPGSCDTLKGSPIERNDGIDYYHLFAFSFNTTFVYIDGISLFGRDCGYGEPAVGVRISAHKAWLESVLLPRPEYQRLVYIDPDRKLLDDCMYTDRTKGTCVREQDCPAIHARLQNKQQISFCSNGTVVCCPNKAIDPRKMAIENEFNECEERYSHLRTTNQDEASHAVEIGWQNDRNTTYGCYGYLISTRGVVSSASCLLEKGVLPNIVRIGGMKSLNESSIIRVENIAIHPNYNAKSIAHNIAVVKLELAVDPTANIFPTCLWQNITHSPVELMVLDFASNKSDPIHPMYKSDCEALLNRSFNQSEMICLKPGYEPYYAIKMPSDLQVYYEHPESPSICYNAGSPIVWRNSIEKNLHVEYFVNLYSHGECGPETPRIVNRIATYIEWFKIVLQ
uniref:Peptidase S1 domain-containing protein n=2 Tax=gambiae species complex TaxID=44542 RepID=A0A1S4H878_ANOGA